MGGEKNEAFSLRLKWPLNDCLPAYRVYPSWLATRDLLSKVGLVIEDLLGACQQQWHLHPSRFLETVTSSYATEEHRGRGGWI